MTGRLGLKYAAQSRQLHHWHADFHYCNTQFKYWRCFCIMYREYTCATFADDKAGVDVGEPDFPISILKQQRRGIQLVENPNVAADHDFHRFKLTPSVWIVVSIPESVGDSFYTGEMHVCVKDAVFKPSTAMRYLAEQAKIAKSTGKVDCPVHMGVGDGGSEHTTQNVSM